MHELIIHSNGEGLYDITPLLKDKLETLLVPSSSGVLHLICMHTSCALLISENYDPTAKQDLENFFKHIAPRNLGFISHTLEGEDDSPSHMKSALCNQSLTLIVENGKAVLGRWQGVFLAEFRDAPKERKVLLKFMSS